MIAEKRRNLLANVDATSTKQLWDSVNSTSCHRNTSDELQSCVGNENVINKFFADIATYHVYNKQEIIDKLIIGNPAEADKLHHVEDFEVQRLLAAIKKISSEMNQFFHIGYLRTAHLHYPTWALTLLICPSPVGDHLLTAVMQ